MEMKDSTTRTLLFVLCVMNVFFEVGIVFQFGVFYITLLDIFQSGRAKTVAVQSLLGGFTLSLGVLSGVLVTKIGIRWVISISCILVPVGFIASFFATRIEHLYVSIGITAGLAIGGILSSQHILVLKVVSIDFVPIGSGLLITSAGVLNFGIGPLFGSIRDSSGSYGIVVLTISAIIATSAVFLTIVLFKRRFSVANGPKKETITISVISVSQTTQN
ncbi:uncharacterized protein LOC132727876 isoform X2 [Ruditapes philippinarum]|uniref:uncharacterized protein LOC132727876 isoform X2 n=1 Tax=Ruditapes philippinarum TaxID=129788 RepID=UPI00295B7937|nr:uncharacterized protein LOC132727876 isoform X2 [Ruditapes philippinarum]